MSIDTKSMKERAGKALSNHNWIITIIVTFLSVGGIEGVSTYLLSSKADDRDNFQIIIDIQRDEISKCKIRLDESTKNLESCRVQNHALRNMISDLESKRTLVEAASLEGPYPEWIKSTNGTMLFINKSYEDVFLIPEGKKISDYLGKTDFDVWPENIAKIYSDNDNEVILTKSVIEFGETVSIGGKKININVSKWPVMIGDLVVGVRGMVYPCNKKEWDKLVKLGR